jgi:hypothetical protein
MADPTNSQEVQSAHSEIQQAEQALQQVSQDLQRATDDPVWASVHNTSIYDLRQKQSQAKSRLDRAKEALGLLSAASTPTMQVSAQGTSAAVDDSEIVQQPTLPPNEVFTPLAPPEPVSTGDTREKPGTGDPNAVVAPDAPATHAGQEPVWLNDLRAQELRTGMALRKWDDFGPPTIRVHYGDDPWFIPDPTFVNMAPGDKYDKAFRQMYDSGLLKEEFKDALLALLDPGAIFFFVAVVGIQFIPGVNVVVDAAAIVILLAAFGSQLDDFLTAMGKVSKAINKDQFDHATNDLAKIIAGISTAVLAALGFAGAKWAKGKLIPDAPAGGTGTPKSKPVSSPTSEPTSPAAKNPVLNQGGVHNALPQEPTSPPPKNPALNQGGVHNALPEPGSGEPLLPIKEHNPPTPGPLVKLLTPEEAAAWEKSVNDGMKQYFEWHRLNPGRDPFSQPPKGWKPPEVGPHGTQKLPSVPNTIEPQGPTNAAAGSNPNPKAKAPQPPQGAAGQSTPAANTTGSAAAGRQEPLLPIKEHHPPTPGPLVKLLTPEEAAAWEKSVNDGMKQYFEWHRLNPGRDAFELPPEGWKPPEVGPHGTQKLPSVPNTVEPRGPIGTRDVGDVGKRATKKAVVGGGILAFCAAAVIAIIALSQGGSSKPSSLSSKSAVSPPVGAASGAPSAASPKVNVDIAAKWLAILQLPGAPPEAGGVTTITDVNDSRLSPLKSQLAGDHFAGFAQRGFTRTTPNPAHPTVTAANYVVSVYVFDGPGDSTAFLNQFLQRDTTAGLTKSGSYATDGVVMQDTSDHVDVLWTQTNAVVRVNVGSSGPASEQAKDATDAADLVAAQATTGAPSMTKDQAASTYLGAVQPVNTAQSAFYAQAQTWNNTTTNAQAVSAALPLRTALHDAQSQLQAIARQYPSARADLEAVTTAAAKLEADLSTLSRLDTIGVNPWAQTYDADRAALIAASNQLRTTLGLPTLNP